MKLRLFFSMMAFAAIAFTGCKNDQTALEINYGKTARLQGQVTIFEETGASNQVASGLKVYAEVPYNYLTTAANNGASSTLEGDKIFETITDEQGVYLFDIPVTENFDSKSSFKVYTERKEFNEKFYYGEISVTNFSSSANATTIKNIDMFATETADAVFKVKGKVLISAIPDNLPAAGFTVEATVDNRTFTTITNASGEYEISLPVNNNILINVPSQIIGDKKYEMTSYYQETPNEDGTVSDITVEEVPAA